MGSLLWRHEATDDEEKMMDFYCYMIMSVSLCLSSIFLIQGLLKVKFKIFSHVA